MQGIESTTGSETASQAALEGIVYDTRPKDSQAPPLVSLIIPVFNVAGYVKQCLASVFAAASTLNLETIIVEDGSTDASHEVVSSILSRYTPTRTLYIRQSNQGLSAVRNLGMKIATGEYIGFLDSDDLLTAGHMRILLDFARAHRCDLVLGRSQVFDSKTHEISPFYDEWAWLRLLGSADSRVVSMHEDPGLFFLEPNANYRLIRRDLLSRCQCSYPRGRLFEDPPVHYQMLLSAQRVGLVNTPYYWYRVNRPGKITAERSQRRFDIIEVARETFDTLSATDISDPAGGAVLYGLLRIVWWCGTMTLPEHRHDFFVQASATFVEHAPRSWLKAFRGHRFPDQILHVVAEGLLRGDSAMLERISYNRRKPWRSFLFLLKAGRTDILLDRASQVWNSRSPLGRTRETP